MDKVSNGGPAFPTYEHISGCDKGGMTLRDYFAAKELASVTDKDICERPSDYARYADHCYRMADAMLAARGAP